MRHIPDNYNWAKPGIYTVRGRGWKVRRTSSDTTIAETVLVHGIKIRFEAGDGELAGNLTIDRIRVAVLVHDSHQVADLMARGLVEEAFEAISAAVEATVAEEARREEHSAAKENAKAARAEAKAAEALKKLH
jgi:hypothetical protein